MNLCVRKGNVSDAKGVSEVTSYTWVTTYKGLLPDEILDERVKTIDERAIKIARSIEEKDNLYVAVDDNKVVGIVTYGKSRNEKYKDSGEIYSIYVLDNYQGFGLGKKLFLTGIKELINMGYDSLILNVLDGNDTINFYKKFGGIKIGEKEEFLGNVKIKENILLFNELNKIYSDFSSKENSKNNSITVR